MTRTTSVIDDCISRLKIRGKPKEKWAKTRKRDTAESTLVQKSGPALAVLPNRRRRPCTRMKIVDIGQWRHWSAQSSRKCRITRTGMQTFTLVRINFTMRESLVHMFFNWHMSRFQKQRDNYTQGDQRRFSHIIKPREASPLSFCVDQSYVLSALNQCMNSDWQDYWCADNVIKLITQGLSDCSFNQTDILILNKCCEQH